MMKLHLIFQHGGGVSESRQADFKLKVEWKTMNHPQCGHKAFSFDFPLPNSSAFQVITNVLMKDEGAAQAKRIAVL